MIQDSQHQARSLATEGVDSLMIPIGDAQAVLASPLSSLSSLSRSTRATPLSEIPVDHAGPPSGEQDEDPRMTSEGDSESVVGGPNAGDGSIPETGLSSSCDVQASSQTSPLSSLSALDEVARDTPMPEISVAHSGQPADERDEEDARMTSDTEGDSISVVGGTTKGDEPVSGVSDHRRRSSPVVVDDRELPSCLPTPPSERATDDVQARVLSRAPSPYEGGTASKLAVRPRLVVSLPGLPAPPPLTPEPSVGEDRGVMVGAGVGSGRHGSLGVFSELQTPLTPLTPSLSVEGFHGEEGALGVGEQSAGHTGVEERARSVDGVGGEAEGLCVDDARSSPRMDQAGVEKPSHAEIDTGAPVITLTHTPPPPSDDGPLVATSEGNLDVSKTPRPSVRTEHNYPDPGANDVGDGYSSPTTAYDYACGSGYDIRFSSPPRCTSPPLTCSMTTTPSRYATPFESSDVGFATATQDEDEVWHALMGLGGAGSRSGVSTPGTVLEHREPSFAPLTVDPSVLHYPPPLPPVHAHGHDEVQAHGQETETRELDGSEGSISSLTSLDETDLDEEGDRDEGNAEAARRASADASISTSDLTERRSGSSRGRRSEPYRAPPSQSLGALGTSTSASLVRAGSEAMAVLRDTARARSTSSTARRVIGGPSASVDELALLARRAPLKIFVRVREGMRGVKRKRDGDEDEDEGAGRLDGLTRVRPTLFLVRDVDQLLTRNFVFYKGVPPDGIGEGPASTTPMPTLTVTHLAPGRSTRDDAEARAEEPNSGLVDDSGLSRKRTRKESERGKPRARVRHKKPKQGASVPPTIPVSTNVQVDQIVGIAAVELEPRSPASEIRPEEEADQDARMSTPIHQGEGRENWAMKSPLSSPTEEDVWEAISKDGGMWPDLPSLFRQWDVQVGFRHLVRLGRLNLFFFSSSSNVTSKRLMRTLLCRN